jgi:hypothetical protein
LKNSKSRTRNPFVGYVPSSLHLAAPISAWIIARLLTESTLGDVGLEVELTPSRGARCYCAVCGCDYYLSLQQGRQNFVKHIQN